MSITIDIISYKDLLNNKSNKEKLECALLEKGIIGIRGVPDFEFISRNYIQAARKFAALPEAVKQHYSPDRDSGVTEGYELGAEQFKDSEGHWQIDSQKASYYAFVPDNKKNVWPTEVDLTSSYLALGELIFKTGKILLTAIGLDESMGLSHSALMGYGRMLHYQKHSASSSNPNWCGAHYDHGLFTGLMPAYYFQDNQEVEEPSEAGLYILPTSGQEFVKANANDKSILYFQVGEFAQLLTHDRIKATKHYVKQAGNNVERFTFALFYSPAADMLIRSDSLLANDERYRNHQAEDNSITYEKWGNASFSRYRVFA